MKTTKGRGITVLCADKRIYHARTHTFNVDPEYEEWETKDTDGVEYELKKVPFTVSVDGLFCIKDNPEDNPDSADSTEVLDMIGQKVDLVLKISIDNAPLASYKAKAVVGSFEGSESVPNKATYKATFKGEGLTKVVDELKA